MVELVNVYERFVDHNLRRGFDEQNDAKCNMYGCGCGTFSNDPGGLRFKVNQANFDKIQTGMTQEEVIAILGSPSESSSIDIVGLSGTSSEWISKEGTISIQFVNKKVRAKRFSKTSN